MPLEPATGIVVRFTDWSETSRIVTLFTRDFGKVRALAKGARRAKSNYESALDLLTVYSMVLLRKSSGSLDLVTEARVIERFTGLTQKLDHLYAAYYVAELLGEGMEDHDPHPGLFDAALDSLRTLSRSIKPPASDVLRFERVYLKELGLEPKLDECVSCRCDVEGEPHLAFDAQAGGLICPDCQRFAKRCHRLSPGLPQSLTALYQSDGDWDDSPKMLKELRLLHNYYVTHLLGKRLRTMGYLKL